MRKSVALILFSMQCLTSSPDYRIVRAMSVSDDPLPVESVAFSFRNYDASITANEKKDITYIIAKTSVEPWYELLRHRSSLNAAGDRILHVHPLRFLMCVFTDQELKEGVRKIYKRGMPVWTEFINGLKKSIKEEYQRGNLRDDQLNHFSKSIGMDSRPLISYIHKNEWTNFVIYLINNVS